MLAALLMGLLCACSKPDHVSEAGVVRVWSHQGREEESKALREIAAKFNDAHRAQGWRVELTFFPDFQFTEKISIAAAANDLPEVFEIDGPLLARYVDARLLAPIDDWVTEADRQDFLPTIIKQGTVAGKLYALGAFDSAVVLYYDREMFARAGVTPPTENETWTWDELLAAGAKLKAAGLEPLSMHMDESADEWFTYAFSPVIWSGGGNLISDDGGRVTGQLASETNLRTLTAWQKVFSSSYAPTDPVDPDLFGNGKVAMDWSGHWMARSHVEKKGVRLGVMRLPRMGAQPSAPCGSWCWGLGVSAQKNAAARAWLAWVTSTQNGVVQMVKANGAVPSRRSAFAAFPEYEKLPYRLFRAQLETIARPRPATPFYATLTQHFAGALRDIARGADVSTRLHEAEHEVQKVIDRRAHREAGGAP